MRELDCTGLKILYLYGYGTSAMLCEREQLAGLKATFPNVDDIEMMPPLKYVTWYLARRLPDDQQDRVIGLLGDDKARKSKQKRYNFGYHRANGKFFLGMSSATARLRGGY